MALTKKMERALYGPSLFEITCGTLLSVILGVLLAAGFLVFKPVEIVKDLPKPEDRKIGTVYYQQGSNDATKAKAWRNKRKQLLEGAPGEIAFAEEELNAWLNADSGSYTSGESSKQPAKAAAPAPTPVTPQPSKDGKDGKGAGRLNPIKLRQMKERRRAIEDEVTRVEAEIADYEVSLANYRTTEESQMFAELLAARRADLEALMNEWEEVAQTIEANS